MHGWLLRLPLIGDLLRKSAIARFSHNTGLLLQSGVVLLDGLAVTAGTTGNKVLEQAILEARDGLERGKGAGGVAGRQRGCSRRWSVTWSRWEKPSAPSIPCSTGVAAFYEEEVDRAVARLTALMEPVLMVVFGSGAGRHRHLHVSADLSDGRHGAVKGLRMNRAVDAKEIVDDAARAYVRGRRACGMRAGRRGRPGLR